MKKIILNFVMAFNLFTQFGCNSSSKQVDICKCLTEPGNSKYMQENKDACREEISKEIGVDNWEKVNMSQNPEISAKFDALARRCK